MEHSGPPVWTEALVVRGQFRFGRLHGWQKLEDVTEKSKNGELILRASQSKIAYAASQGRSLQTPQEDYAVCDDCDSDAFQYPYPNLNISNVSQAVGQMRASDHRPLGRYLFLEMASDGEGVTLVNGNGNLTDKNHSTCGANK